MDDRATGTLVIGGGIGGMAAAIALRQHGIAVDLIEKAAEWKADGAGITITGPTLRAFRDLGIFDAIAKAGFFSKGANMYRYDGALLSSTANIPIEPDLPAAGGIMRPDLHHILSERVRSSGVSVRTGVSVLRLDQDDEGVDVAFSDGTARRYAMVVAADGIYSETRRMLFPDAPGPVYAGQMSWRVVAPRPADMEVTHFFFGHKHVGGINPCSNEHVYAFVLNPEEVPTRVPDEDKIRVLRDLMADFGGSMAVVRDGIGPDSSIVQRPFEYFFLSGEWSRGRVVLIGDAAHATTPHLASGAGMAVEDGIVLAEEVARSPDDVEGAIEAFVKRRYERCKFVVEASAGIAQAQLASGTPEEIGRRMAQAMQKLAEPI